VPQVRETLVTMPSEVEECPLLHYEEEADASLSREEIKSLSHSKSKLNLFESVRSEDAPTLDLNPQFQQELEGEEGLVGASGREEELEAEVLFLKDQLFRLKEVE